MQLVQVNKGNLSGYSRRHTEPGLGEMGIIKFMAALDSAPNYTVKLWHCIMTNKWNLIYGQTDSRPQG